MSRLFTFGCSNTKYYWPTWSDILLTQIEGENWGLSGSGNKCIFESLVECTVRNNLSEDDIIIIMWTSWFREDRYINNQWVTPGNVYNAKPYYDEDFIKKYWDDIGSILDSYNWICGAIKILEGLKCTWYMTSYLPFFKALEPYHNNRLKRDITKANFDLYIEFIKRHENNIIPELGIEPNPTYWSKTRWAYNGATDNHALPNYHYNWLNTNVFHRLSSVIDLNKDELKAFAELHDHWHKTNPHPSMLNEDENFWKPKKINRY